MGEAIKSSIIISMVETLDLNELGAAVRILARLIEKKTPIPLKTIHLVTGLNKAEWLEISPSVLAFFSISETHIALQDTFLNIPQIAADARKPRKGITSPMFPDNPVGHRPEALPSYLAARPKAVTLKQAIYDTGLRLLMNHGMTEKMGRAVLSNFITTYTAGEVAIVMEEARKQNELSDPHSWMVAQLRRRASSSKSRSRPVKSNGTADTMQSELPKKTEEMSSTTIEKIRLQNKAISEGRKQSNSDKFSSAAPRVDNKK
jgi:hypothetical protein